MQSVWRYEHAGWHGPDREALAGLAAVLGVSQGWLLGEGPDEVPPAEDGAQAAGEGSAA